MLACSQYVSNGDLFCYGGNRAIIFQIDLYMPSMPAYSGLFILTLILFIIFKAKLLKNTSGENKCAS